MVANSKNRHKTRKGPKNKTGFRAVVQQVPDVVGVGRAPIIKADMGNPGGTWGTPMLQSAIFQSTCQTYIRPRSPVQIPRSGLAGSGGGLLIAPPQHSPSTPPDDI